MAQDPLPPPSPDADALPPPPMPADEREGIEPEVTIIRKADRTVEEYRIGGELYMIKITPRRGVPYYLVDTDGDGSLETRRNELDPKLLIPSWIIFRW
ncbi:MAG: DUF2782 domain-containing protein [Gammaproteobacteria bacterium]|nr:DUF2782 domain-containing protein [Gammaproteobacteria bacterium]